MSELILNKAILITISLPKVVSQKQMLSRTNTSTSRPCQVEMLTLIGSRSQAKNECKEMLQ